jgi:hypothetical protein
VPGERTDEGVENGTVHDDGRNLGFRRGVHRSPGHSFEGRCRKAAPADEQRAHGVA